MPHKYPKLVRDNIPQIIRDKGQKPITRIVEGEEYHEFLIEKLREEIEEFIESQNEEELADVQEVLAAIAGLKGLNNLNVERIRADKAQKRGKFDKKIILEGIE